MDIIGRLIDLSTRPVPLRTLVMRKLLARWPVGPYRARLTAGAVNRPGYGLCMYHAAEEARELGYKAITAIELGVAGGQGILCMCEHREEIRKALGIEIHLLGFDSGTGLPSSDDPRDVRYYWAPGAYEMDRPSLEKRLAGRARIIFGNIADLDLYSSTMAAFGLFSMENVLPRIWCHFDDVAGGPLHALVDRVGEREAIRQFNLAPERELQHDMLSRAYVFATKTPEWWHEKIYLYHRQSHPSYNRCLLNKEQQQLRLDSV
jgi:hypothetical protein